jgi:hypothetical protein
MKRLLNAGVLVCLVVLIAPPAHAEDEITYLDRAGKEARLSGTIQSESPGQILIKPTVGSALKTVPARAVVDVAYNMPLAQKQAYRSAVRLEGTSERAAKEEDRRRDLAAAIKAYEDLRDRLSEERARRQAEFKVARLQARRAEDDPATADAAIASLTRFMNQYPKSWQLTRCADLLAGLQESREDWAGAQRTYEGLAAVPDLPPEVRQEVELKVVHTLTAARRYADAEKRIEELSRTTPPDGIQAARLQIALAECQAAAGKAEPAAALLEALINRTGDPDVKALAYNALGDCHRLANKPKDALWDYLWVDVIYHQNREEHARALYHIAKLFAELKDDARAKQYRERLEKDRQFSGLKYQKQLAAGK